MLGFYILIEGRELVIRCRDDLQARRSEKCGREWTSVLWRDRFRLAKKVKRTFQGEVDNTGNFADGWLWVTGYSAKDFKSWRRMIYGIKTRDIRSLMEMRIWVMTLNHELLASDKAGIRYIIAYFPMVSKQWVVGCIMRREVWEWRCGGWGRGWSSLEQGSTLLIPGASPQHSIPLLDKMDFTYSPQGSQVFPGSFMPSVHNVRLHNF